MAGELFVGRSREVEVLRGLLAEVKAGVGGVVLVAGEQGVGKSSLLRAGLGGAEDQGCRLLWGAADELGQRIPLWLMGEALGGVEGVTAGDGVMGGDAVAAGVERLLAAVDRLCAESPVVLVAEDLQWADEASLLMWHRLSRAVGQLPLVLAGSGRPGAGTEDLARLRRAVAERDGAVIDLCPLADGEVRELAGALAGGRPGRRLAEVVERAGGNPLYTRELVDGLVRERRVRVAGGVAELSGALEVVPVPASLAAAVQGRLRALPEDAVRVLRWAALLGQEFSVTDLEVVSGRSAGELMRVLDAALGAGVLVEAGMRLGFRHGLIRQALYEGMPAGLRAALHLQAARMLAEAGAAPERVAAQLVPAGLDLVPGQESGPLAGMPAGDTDPQRTAETSWLVAFAMMRTGRAAEALSLVTQELGRQGLSGSRQARLRALHAMTLNATSQYDRAETAARQALAEQGGDRLAAGYALHALATVSFNRRQEAARLEYIDRALSLIEMDPQATDLRLLLLTNKAFHLSDLDRPGEAIVMARQALALAERAGTPRVHVVRSTLGELHFEAGEWDDALAELDPAPAAVGTANQRLRIHGMWALIAGHRGDRETAARHLRAVDDDEHLSAEVFPASWVFVRLARSLAIEQDGRLAEAMAVLAECFEPGIAERMPGVCGLAVPLARLAMTGGDRETAAVAMRRAEMEAERGREPLKVAIAEHCRGLVTGDLALLLSAAAYFQKADRRLYRAQALEDAAAVEAERGELAAAQQYLAQALGIYTALGAAWDVERAATRLDGFGVRASRAAYRARPATGWEALTPTEVKVAYLVADGRSNPDVAAALVLSRNTVQTHVSHILAKLGARSRAEIIREAVRHPPARLPATG